MSEQQNLCEAAREIVASADLGRKIALSEATATAWLDRRLSTGRLSSDRPMPVRPGRPERPLLLPPRSMPRRSTGGEKGRIALMHSLAHIELNAVDMTWDLVGRFGHEPLPRSFLDDWVTVAAEEGRHFAMVSRRLEEMGAAYGDLPAHDGLWQAAQATGHDLTARIAVVPLVLEARGLDVSPGIFQSLRAAGRPRLRRRRRGHLSRRKAARRVRRQVVPLPLRTRRPATGADVSNAGAKQFPRPDQTAVQRQGPIRGRIDARIL